MPRPRSRKRTRIFFAFEGESENAFGAWLQDLCNDQGLFVHLDRPRMKGGGDPLALVKCALRLRAESRKRAGEGHRHSFLLIDTDRLDDKSKRSEDAVALARKESLDLIRQVPCFEAVLLRLHDGRERDRPPDTTRALEQLGKVWPGYRRPVRRQQLSTRFRRDDLHRLADIDPDICRLLKKLGLRQPR
ncbi:MAG: hypothetical protein JNM75_02920 [Rhodospirillales bacterium]|nr:hypothetical protein [Rhodospirillales bacterium]